MKKIEHIGIAVSDIAESNKLFAKILGKQHYKEERVSSEGVITSFFQIGDSKIELIASDSTDNAISRYLLNHKESMHHIAIEVDDIFKEMQRLKEEGIRLLNDTPKNGADSKLICFLHPKDTNHILIELTQQIR